MAPGPGIPHIPATASPSTSDRESPAWASASFAASRCMESIVVPGSALPRSCVGTSATPTMTGCRLMFGSFPAGSDQRVDGDRAPAPRADDEGIDVDGVKRVRIGGREDG